MASERLSRLQLCLRAWRRAEAPYTHGTIAAGHQDLGQA
jgi:hypothetical protein